MPEKKTVEKAQRALRQGKSPSTAAGEFVREEMEHMHEGKHGARSPQQAIAIGLSKARRAGIPLEAPKGDQAMARTRQLTKQAYQAGQKKRKQRAQSKRRGTAA